jgi:large subunit ribosomal protein L5e
VSHHSTSAYCTGLLVARRVLKKLGLADKYVGVEATGAEYHVTPLESGPRPFRVILDVGLARTTTGARVFAAMKVFSLVPYLLFSCEIST